MHLRQPLHGNWSDVRPRSVAQVKQAIRCVSAEEPGDRLARTERHGPADGCDDFVCRVDAEDFENRGEQVGHLDRILGRFALAFGIGRSNDEAVPQSAAADQAGKTAGPMVAAIERVDRRAASELADDEDDRRLHEIAFVQIAQQGRECRVEHASRSGGGR